MSTNTKIEWTDHTVNFWWGCTKVSPGCKHCYADSWASRWGKDIWGPNKPRERKKSGWNDIQKYNRTNHPSGRKWRVFTQSMSDMFEDHPMLVQWRTEALLLLESCTNLQIQLLTKRPQNIKKMVPTHWLQNWPSHIWIGTSVENQDAADERIPELLNIPAKVRFLSMEPLLSPVDLCNIYYDNIVAVDCLNGLVGFPTPHAPLDKAWPVDWVIIGGESGPQARPFNLAWAYKIINQCKEAMVPVFVKQLGANPASVQCGYSIKDKKGGNWHEWPEDLRVRQFPGVSQ